MYKNVIYIYIYKIDPVEHLSLTGQISDMLCFRFVSLLEKCSDFLMNRIITAAKTVNKFVTVLVMKIV